MKQAPRLIPLTISIVLHGAALYAASRMSWVAVDVVEREQYQVVWLRESIVPHVLPDDVTPSEPTQPESREPSAEDEVPATRELNEPPDEADSSDEPEERSATAVPQLPDETTIDESVDDGDRKADERVPATDSDSADTPRPRAYLRAEVDWEEERRQAVARVREQREREEAYRTFSLDDVGEDAPQEEAGQPSKSVFDSATAWRSGMTYVDSTGATIEWVSDRCYRKSGGAGNIFAFPDSVAAADIPMTACVRLIPRRDLFEDAKPEYLKVRPSGQFATPPR